MLSKRDKEAQKAEFALRFINYLLELRERNDGNKA